MDLCVHTGSCLGGTPGSNICGVHGRATLRKTRGLTCTAALILEEGTADTAPFERALQARPEPSVKAWQGKGRDDCALTTILHYPKV